MWAAVVWWALEGSSEAELEQRVTVIREAPPELRAMSPAGLELPVGAVLEVRVEQPPAAAPWVVPPAALVELARAGRAERERRVPAAARERRVPAAARPGLLAQALPAMAPIAAPVGTPA